MAEETPPKGPGGTEVTIVNENLEISMNAANRSKKSVPPLTEDDRTLRNHALQILHRTLTTPAGAAVVGPESEVLAEAETDGTPKVVNYGKDSSGNIDAFRTNASLQPQVEIVDPSVVITPLQGQDEAANADYLRTDPSRILWTRDYRPWVQIDPVAITNAQVTVLDGSALLTTGGVYEVEFKVVNFAVGAAVIVSVGMDIAAAGALAYPNYWLVNQTYAAAAGDEAPGWMGPFLINADDDVRAEADADTRAQIHFRVRRVDTGA